MTTEKPKNGAREAVRKIMRELAKLDEAQAVIVLKSLAPQYGLICTGGESE